jgi:hypothetical protein
MQRRVSFALALTLALVLATASAVQLRASSSISGSAALTTVTAAQDDDPAGVGSLALVPNGLLLALLGFLLAAVVPGSSAAPARFAPDAARSRAPPTS